MCGIAGYFVREGVEWRPSKDFICDLITGIQQRGYDATGYGTLLDDGSMYVYKGPISSWRFLQDFRKEDHPIGRVGIVHTRGANVGSADNNENNHPLPFEDEGRAVIVVHNGTVGNLDEAYTKLGVKKTAEVDSALIAAALGKKGAAQGLEFLQEKSCGSAAIAALFDNGSLLLARDTSPLYISQPQPGALVWSSEKDPLLKISEVDTEFGFRVANTWGVADSQFWYWNKAGERIAQGKFRLPIMFKPPEFLKFKNTGTAFETGKSEFDKRAGFKADKKDDTTDGSKRELVLHETRGYEERSLPTNKLTMEAEHNIPCNWSGCWKRSQYRIKYVNGRWIPLCHPHTQKWEKKGKDLVLSSTHEMARKLTAMVVK